MADPIPSVIKSPTLGPPESRRYATVQIATKRGIQTKRVREDRLEKDYGRLDYKDREVYARKVKVVVQRDNKIRTVEKAVNPKVLNRMYTKTRIGEYKKYEPDKTIIITTSDNRNAIVTEEQLKKDWKPAGRNRYERARPGVTVYKPEGGQEFRPVAEREAQRQYERETGRPAPRIKKMTPRGGATYYINAKIFTEDGSEYVVQAYKRIGISSDQASLESTSEFRIQQAAWFKYGIDYDEVVRIEITSIDQVYLEGS